MEALLNSATYPEHTGSKNHVPHFWLPILGSHRDVSHNLLEEDRLTVFPGTRSLEPVAAGDAPGIVPPLQPGKGVSLLPTAETSDLPVAGNDILYEYTLG